jgi:hypothetical protein
LKKEPLSVELQNRMNEYLSEGLIPTNFEPRGESDWERRRSIDSKAYIGWLEKNPERTVGYDVEMARTIFLKRFEPGWVPPPPDPIEPLPELEERAPAGFDTAAAALPKGDAWEGGVDLFAEDVPPPMEG